MFAPTIRALVVHPPVAPRSDPTDAEQAEQIRPSSSDRCWDERSERSDRRKVRPTKGPTDERSDRRKVRPTLIGPIGPTDRSDRRRPIGPTDVGAKSAKGPERSDRRWRQVRKVRPTSKGPTDVGAKSAKVRRGGPERSDRRKVRPTRRGPTDAERSDRRRGEVRPTLAPSPRKYVADKPLQLVRPTQARPTLARVREGDGLAGPPVGPGRATMAAHDLP